MSGERLAGSAFWNGPVSRFPSLKGAASTAYYFDCERLLIDTLLPSVAGQRILKTDLWDEAKNTEILRWVTGRGADAVGIDVSLGIARQARDVLRGERATILVADVRALPFRSDTFDAAYSMGTIEHFPDSAVAVRELFRVLKPGGQAIVGVPNKLDPFLRPLLVHALNVLGRYAYGMERSFTPGSLRRLLASAGFRVTALSGILFMPGWLRMLDLWCHVHRLRLAAVTGWCVRPFAWAYRNLPFVRRHGYLIACLATKPTAPESGRPAPREGALVF